MLHNKDKEELTFKEIADYLNDKQIENETVYTKTQAKKVLEKDLNITNTQTAWAKEGRDYQTVVILVSHMDKVFEIDIERIGDAYSEEPWLVRPSLVYRNQKDIKKRIERLINQDFQDKHFKKSFSFSILKDKALGTYLICDYHEEKTHEYFEKINKLEEEMKKLKEKRTYHLMRY